MTSPGYDDGAEVRVILGDSGQVPPTGATARPGQAGPASGAKEQAGQVAGTAKEQAGQVAGTAKEQAGQVTGTAKEQAGQVAGTAKEQAGQVTGTAKEQVADVAGTAKEQATQVAGQAADQARDLLGQARTQVQQQVTSQKGQLTDKLRQLAEELSDLAAGKGAPQGAVSQVAGLAQQASSRAQRLADYVEQREPSQLLDDGRTFAARRPGAFLAGAALLGALAGRVVKGNKADATSSVSGSVPVTPSYGTAPVAPVPVRPVSEVPMTPTAVPASHGALTSTAPLGTVDAPAERFPIDDVPLSGRMPNDPASGLLPPVTDRPGGGPYGG